MCNHSRDSNIHMVVSHTKGMGENSKNKCCKMCIPVYCKGSNTIKNFLMAKGHHHTEKWSDYRYRCNRIECDDEYVWESAMIFGQNSRNILGPLPPLMTMLTSQVVTPVLITSTLWVENHPTLPGPSKRTYT